ncbi:hypothetical protein [Cupriavidus pinatubonensis]|uniref:Uncharacterized protein n=1 Tax=Cupriavidus pinatubonensis TaxID=248026 RepID=A0ABM8Y130_9BURK|nr:hypothetical protein [Cupriavidus pinatubonensis]CAG9186418.1 hypothetical protein LMG23994_06216 [Cupriavidus pinatubonensis]
MKRTRWLAALGAGMAAGMAVGLTTGGSGMFSDRDESDEHRVGISRWSADAGREACDDACVRSRGVAALTVLGQRPAP